MVPAASIATDQAKLDPPPTGEANSVSTPGFSKRVTCAPKDAKWTVRKFRSPVSTWMVYVHSDPDMGRLPSAGLVSLAYPCQLMIPDPVPQLYPADPTSITVAMAFPENATTNKAMISSPTPILSSIP